MTVRLTVAFEHFGPYHIARAKALLGHQCFEPSFIELAPADSAHQWETAGLRDGLGVRTIPGGSRIQELRRVLHETRPDVVAVCGYSNRSMRALAEMAAGSGAGTILFFETNAWDRPRNSVREMLKSAWLRRFVDAALVGGISHRQYLEKLGVRRDHIWDCYDVVDNDYFDARARDPRPTDLAAELRSLGPYFLYVGRFAPEKNLTTLLRAYREYRLTVRRPWRLVLAGGGPEEPALRREAEALGIDPLWGGYRQYDELPQFYASAGCFVLPSAREPWGLVVNEAMAAGLPVLVSSMCGCAADLVKDGENGFTFAPADAHVLASSMAAIASLSDEGLRSMRAASREIVSRYTVQQFAANVCHAAGAVIAK